MSKMSPSRLTQQKIVLFPFLLASMALSASYSLLPPSSPARPSTLITRIQSLSSSSSSSTTTTAAAASSSASVSNGNTRRMLLASTGAIFFQSLVARSEIEKEEEGEEEDRTVRIFQENTSSVVCIKDLQLVAGTRNSTLGGDDDDGAVKVEGTGSGFIWDDKGHIVTNYHVIAKFATDNTGLQRCKVFIQDSNGTSTAKEGKLVGYDPARDLAVLKVDIDGNKLRPAVIGTSHDLTVGQSCFAIGNPFGYEHTLTTGVVSGLGREIPSSNGQSIRGAIQTDAAINAGNSGGPLIDSYGRVIGVNTATFTRKGTGLSSGVNFAIPIDIVVRTVPYLIVNGTSTPNLFF